MKTSKYSIEDTTEVKQPTKIIYKYPSPTDKFDIGRMMVDGRSPEGEGEFIIEDASDFLIYVLSGNGKYFIDDATYDLKQGDVLFVVKGSKAAVEGKIEFIKIDVPAFSPDQTRKVGSKDV